MIDDVMTMKSFEFLISLVFVMLIKHSFDSIEDLFVHEENLFYSNYSHCYATRHSLYRYVVQFFVIVVAFVVPILRSSLGHVLDVIQRHDLFVRSLNCSWMMSLTKMMKEEPTVLFSKFDE